MITSISTPAFGNGKILYQDQCLTVTLNKKIMTGDGPRLLYFVSNHCGFDISYHAFHVHRNQIIDAYEKNKRGSSAAKGTFKVLTRY